MEPKHKYNIPALLASIVGYKGIPYPGGFLPRRPVGGYKKNTTGTAIIEPSVQEFTDKGSRLRDVNWSTWLWYFMPVCFRHPSLSDMNTAFARNFAMKDGKLREGFTDNTLELPNAVISITGQKTIVETPMVGRKGSVKEFINIDDYQVSIAAFLHTQGRYPEAEITQIRNLYNINESVELISALTDLVFDEDDRVVITDIEFPSTPGIEDGQAVTLKCVTDKEFELIID